MIKKCCSVLVFCVGSCLLAACETSPVKPWQRGDLARAEMAWEPDPMESSLRDHVYTSKEGSSGGVGTGGGGCGCY
ncbi:MAG: hypothetical protein CMK89_04505 [Pseudomonadales bacterium]|nr:hypothetical protein [Pseudomonadales bacterium]